MTNDRNEQNENDLGLLQEMVDAVRDDVPEQSQWENAHRNLMDQLSITDAGAKKGLAIAVRRAAGSTRVRWAASVAAAAAVILLAVVVFFSGESRLAFATVLEQIRDFRPHSYTETLQYEGKTPQTKRIMRLSPQRRREIWPDGEVFVVDLSQSPNRTLLLQPEQRRAVEEVLKGTGPRQDPNLLQALSTMRDQAAQRLGVRKLHDRNAEGFHLQGVEVDWIVWADPRTGLPIRIELTQENLARKFVWDEFDFNVQFDESLFSTKAPQGYTVVQAEQDGTTPTEQDLLAGLRAMATALGGRFPDAFELQALSQAIAEHRKKNPSLPKEEANSLGEKTSRAIRYAQILEGVQHAADVRYVGKGVKLGDAGSAVFWWRPKASEQYRVVFGDLSVKEVRPEDLPSTGTQDRSSSTPSGGFRGVFFNPNIKHRSFAGYPWPLFDPYGAEYRTQIRAALRELVTEADINLVDVFIAIPFTLSHPPQAPRAGQPLSQWANTRFLDNVAVFVDDCHDAGILVQFDLADNRWIPYRVDSEHHIGRPGNSAWPVADDTPWDESATWYTAVINYVESRAKHPESIAMWGMMGNYSYQDQEVFNQPTGIRCLDGRWKTDLVQAIQSQKR
jgi:hypothetical protein